MTEDSPSRDRVSKQERQAARRRAAVERARRRLLRRTLVAGLVLLLPALWLVDRTGPRAEVEAEVIRTHIWRHRPKGGRSHIHTDAILLIQGLSKVTLRRVDTLEKGQRVRVVVRHGRLTGWPYFVELAGGQVPVPAPEPEGLPVGQIGEELGGIPEELEGALEEEPGAGAEGSLEPD